MCFTLSQPLLRGIATLFVVSLRESLVKVLRCEEVLNFTLSDAVCSKSILLTRVTSVSNLIEPHLSSVILGTETSVGVSLLALLGEELLNVATSGLRTLPNLMSSLDFKAVLWEISLLKNLLNFLRGLPLA